MSLLNAGEHQTALPTEELPVRRLLPLPTPRQKQTIISGGTPGFHRALTRARETARELWIRGCGHSLASPSNPAATVIFDTTAGRRQPQLLTHNDSTTVETPCGLTWHALERWLNQHGFTTPVLPDYLKLSIGGTLSTGGIGTGSTTHGLQADLVERILLIDGHDTYHWCSPTDNPDLFRMALCCQGQLGFLDTAVLRVAPLIPSSHDERNLSHHSLRGLVDFALELPPTVHDYLGTWTPQAITSTLDSTKSPFAIHDDTRRWLARFTRHQRLWADYVLDDNNVAEFADHIAHLLNHPPLANTCQQVLTSIIRRPAKAIPFAFAPTSHSQSTAYAVGVYAMVADTDDPRPTRQALQELLEHCIELGGRPYLAGIHDLDLTLARRCYGNDIDQLRDLRTRHATNIMATVIPGC